MKYALGSITGEQIRAARALSRTEQSALAEKTSLSLQTIKRLEGIRGSVDANVGTLKAIVHAFAEMGIQFQDPNQGVGVLKTKCDEEPIARRTITTGFGNASWTDDLYRLVYFSSAVPKQSWMDSSALADLEQVSKSRNESLIITGALLIYEGKFLQALEGPRGAVKELYGSIGVDCRHQGLTIIESRTVGQRHFQSWSVFLGQDIIEGGSLSEEAAFKNGFTPECLTPATAIGILSMASEALCRKQRLPDMSR